MLLVHALTVCVLGVGSHPISALRRDRLFAVVSHHALVAAAQFHLARLASRRHGVAQQAAVVRARRTAGARSPRTGHRPVRRLQAVPAAAAADVVPGFPGRPLHNRRQYAAPSVRPGGPRRTLRGSDFHVLRSDAAAASGFQLLLRFRSFLELRQRDTCLDFVVLG